ncbi:bifunctional acetate--CoA ligase family protein/GNAT family N-acetyltransferase [Arhodomonas aquaeolei]|uniref:bifunctional acetate--CoA ligase family protein/GNAT family N-acetyltransferase n=1 Tax=Arhodomonas aquaeolei TaxID=2369 RepID=UPI0003734943|nr:bifunctional acetate--CoA ligase family protein/GNAT family N-acetyltransferase [Arhodomonas aquaeolei]
MTVRNLEYLFKPRSIALIGASRREGSVGSVVARNLFKSGFEGPIMPVNPKHRAVQGVLAYPDVASLPMTPDLAVIATPPETIPGIIEELGTHGTKAAIVITAGFGEGHDERGETLRQAMLDAARPHLMRILGPNCLGLIVPGAGLNASFAHLSPPRGRIAFVTQSGAIVTAVLDWAQNHSIGFSHMISLGDMADADFGDLLDYLANDPDTGAILLYVEAITDARKFMSAARAASRMKPVIVVKSGRHAEGARAAASHTGALAGSDKVYDAAFRRAGMLRVDTLGELFAAVETLALAPTPNGDRLAILTNGGGMGVLATDALIERGGHLAELSEETVEKLNEHLPATWSRGNPVDIIGDAPGERYSQALETLMAAREVDAVLALNCPTAIADPGEAAGAIVFTLGRHRRRGRKPVLTSWVGDFLAVPARRQFADAGIPTYTTPEGAVRAFMHVVEFHHNQLALLETPPSVPESFTPNIEHARSLVTAARDEGREWLSEAEAKELLAAYGVPVVPTRIARDPEDAARVAGDLEGPFAIKILSPDISHKSDVGGVALDVADAEEVREATESIVTRVRRHKPDARLEGFTIQPMIIRSDALELIAGVTEDDQFGPVVLFGQGGTAVEVIRDQALGLPPLNMKLAYDMMERTRIDRQLRGYRGVPAADRDAIALTLVRLSQIVADLGEVAELDINPLLADHRGVMALDARVRVGRGSGSGTGRLAIRPYPRELEETIPGEDGHELRLRPITPEDEMPLRDAFTRLSPEQVRLRFFMPMKRMTHMQAARFTQIDYDRDMALVLTDPGMPGHATIHGVVHINADPDNTRAEYAIIIHRSLTGRGLGRLMMERIIEYARSRGIQEIFGDVLRENQIMLRLCQELGFRRRAHPDEPDVVRVTLDLREHADPPPEPA